MDTDRPFPCLDGHKYSGCVGQACGVERCWNGRRVRVDPGAELTADSFDRPLKVLRYTASECATCRHAADLQVPGELRSAAGRLVKRWAICDLDLWAAPASLYNLLNHRAPKKYLGHCPSFQATPPEQMRPELVRQRQADQARSRERRARLRAAKRERGSGTEAA